MKCGGFRKPGHFCQEGNVATVAAAAIREAKAGGFRKKPALGSQLGSGPSPQGSQEAAS